MRLAMCWKVRGLNPGEGKRFTILHTRPDVPCYQPPFCTMDKGALELGLNGPWSDLDHSLGLRVRRPILLRTLHPPPFVLAIAACYGVKFNVADYKVFHYVISSVYVAAFFFGPAYSSPFCSRTHSNFVCFFREKTTFTPLITNFILLILHSLSVCSTRQTRHCRLLISFISFVFYPIQRASELPDCACS